MKKLVIFDLDGTLLNTLGGIASACNKALEQYGFHTWTLEEYRGFIGTGTRNLIKNAMPADKKEDDALIDEIKACYLEIYRFNLMEATMPYPGIESLLELLGSQGIKIAAASNKFEDGVCSLLEYFFPCTEFAAIKGQKDGYPIKPDPYMVNEILSQLSIDREDVLYVGDSGVDMKTAIAAGLESVGVSWGYRTAEVLKQAGAMHIIDKPSELVKFL